MTPWQVDADGVTLHVRATPRSSRSAVKGVEVLADGRSVLAVAVAALPSDGEANEALIAYLAKALGVRRSAIAVRAGASARIKRLRIEGAPDGIVTALQSLAG